MDVWSSRNKGVEFLFSCLALDTPAARLTAFGVSALLLTYANVTGWGVPCVWENLFDYCPAEGVTRGVTAFLRGDIKAAAEYNAAAIVIVPLVSLIALRDIAGLLRQFSLQKRLKT